MKIIYDPKFIDAFNAIWDFIAKYSKIKANDFKNALKNEIENLPYMPYKCRKSIYFNDNRYKKIQKRVLISTSSPTQL